MEWDTERRKRLASLPFSEKLKILEKLRERDRVIAASGLRKTVARRKEGEKRAEGNSQHCTSA